MSRRDQHYSFAIENPANAILLPDQRFPLQQERGPNHSRPHGSSNGHATTCKFCALLNLTIQPFNPTLDAQPDCANKSPNPGNRDRHPRCYRIHNPRISRRRPCNKAYSTQSRTVSVSGRPSYPSRDRPQDSSSAPCLFAEPKLCSSTGLDGTSTSLPRLSPDFGVTVASQFIRESPNILQYFGSWRCGCLGDTASGLRHVHRLLLELIPRLLSRAHRPPRLWCWKVSLVSQSTLSIIVHRSGQARATSAGRCTKQNSLLAILAFFRPSTRHPPATSRPTVRNHQSNPHSGYQDTITVVYLPAT